MYYIYIYILTQTHVHVYIYICACRCAYVVYCYANMRTCKDVSTENCCTPHVNRWCGCNSRWCSSICVVTVSLCIIKQTSVLQDCIGNFGVFKDMGMNAVGAMSIVSAAYLFFTYTFTVYCHYKGSIQVLVGWQFGI